MLLLNVLLLLLVGVVCSVTVQKELIIPRPPWPYSHVCSMAEMNDGTLVAVWQAGSGEKHADSSLWTAHKPMDSTEWSAPSVAVSGNGTCVMNAVLYRNDSDFLHLGLHYGGGANGTCYIDGWNPGVTSVRKSGSYGSSQGDWFPFNAIPNRAMGPVKNQCVNLQGAYAGRVLCGSSDESKYGDTSHFAMTDQRFSNWTWSGNIHAWCFSMIQPLIFEPSDFAKGHVFALFRSACKHILSAHSTDYGKSWPLFASSTELPNPNSGLGGTTMKNTTVGWLLAFNNATSQRTPLSLASSTDEGQTWNHLVDVETGPGSYAYPFVIQSRRDPNTAFMCYTHNPQGSFNSIAFATIKF